MEKPPEFVLTAPTARSHPIGQSRYDRSIYYPHRPPDLVSKNLLINRLQRLLQRKARSASCEEDSAISYVTTITPIKNHKKKAQDTEYYMDPELSGQLRELYGDCDELGASMRRQWDCALRFVDSFERWDSHGTIDQFDCDKLEEALKEIETLADSQTTWSDLNPSLDAQRSLLLPTLARIKDENVIPDLDSSLVQSSKQYKHALGTVAAHVIHGLDLRPEFAPSVEAQTKIKRFCARYLHPNTEPRSLQGLKSMLAKAMQKLWTEANHELGRAR